MIRLVESPATELRLTEGRAFVREHAADGDVLIVAASRGAADDLARSIAITTGATLGLHRLSGTPLAGAVAVHAARNSPSLP